MTDMEETGEENKDMGANPSISTVDRKDKNMKNKAGWEKALLWVLLGAALYAGGTAAIDAGMNRLYSAAMEMWGVTSANLYLAPAWIKIIVYGWGAFSALLQALWVLLCCTLLYRVWKKRPFGAFGKHTLDGEKQGKGKHWKRFAGFAVGFGIGICAAILCGGILLLTDGVRMGYPLNMPRFSVNILLYFLTIFFSSVGMEWFFRGYVYRGLAGWGENKENEVVSDTEIKPREREKQIIGRARKNADGIRKKWWKIRKQDMPVIVASALFGIIHGLAGTMLNGGVSGGTPAGGGSGGWTAVIFLLNAVLLSVILCRMYRLRGNIWAGVGLRLGLYWTLQAVLGTGGANGVYELYFTSRACFSGGLLGPMAGLCMTILVAGMWVFPGIIRRIQPGRT